MSDQSFWKRIYRWRKINIMKTVYFNLRMFPFKTAFKWPVVFYESICLDNLSGRIIIEGPVSRAMVRFGYPYQMVITSRKCAQLTLKGTLIVRNKVNFGIDTVVYVDRGATLDVGKETYFGSQGQIICCDEIKIGNHAYIGSECQVMDTSFHFIRDLETSQIKNLTTPVNIGEYSFIGSRVTILKGSHIPAHITIATGSICNKDYTALSENSLIGGVPARLLKSGYECIYGEEEKSLYRKHAEKMEQRSLEQDN